jgi:hypothetical protein
MDPEAFNTIHLDDKEKHIEEEHVKQVATPLDPHGFALVPRPSRFRDDPLVRDQPKKKKKDNNNHWVSLNEFRRTGHPGSNGSSSSKLPSWLSSAPSIPP